MENQKPKNPNNSTGPSRDNAFLSQPILLLTLVILTFLFYLPLLHNNFVYWDDPKMIQANPLIRSLSLSSLKNMWMSFQSGYWIPLTWLSLAIDYSIDGLNPTVFHLTNLILHVLNIMLVFILCRKVLALSIHPSKPPQASNSTFIFQTAFLSAALFALHPIHVESVAWATERKDVLYALFYLLSLFYYLNYAVSSQRKKWNYLLSLLFSALSLLAKPMAVSLPVVLLILDWWPLRRIRSSFYKILVEKIPFAIVVFFASYMAILTQFKGNALNLTAELPLSFRIMNAFHSLIFYLEKMILPFGLVPFYPIVHPDQNTYTFQNFLAVFLVLLITFYVWRHRIKRPYLMAAWIYYLVGLLPVLGIVQAGLQTAADRFVYLPSAGILFLASAGIVHYLSNNGRRFIAIAVVLLATLGFKTMSQIGIWKNSITLWESVVQKYPDVSQLAQTYLGESYEMAGRFDDALYEYQEALALPSPNSHIYNLEGIVLLKLRRTDEAIQAFKSAVKLNTDPDPTLSYKYLWQAYQLKGDQSGALSTMEEATKMAPNSAECQYYLGISLWDKKLFRKSEEAFQKALSLDPQNMNYLVTLAAFYTKEKHAQKAVEILQAAVQSNPQSPQIYHQLGLAYAQLGQKDLAQQFFKKEKLFSTNYSPFEER